MANESDFIAKIKTLTFGFGSKANTPPNGFPKPPAEITLPNGKKGKFVGGMLVEIELKRQRRPAAEERSFAE